MQFNLLIMHKLYFIMRFRGLKFCKVDDDLLYLTNRHANDPGLMEINRQVFSFCKAVVQ